MEPLALHEFHQGLNARFGEVNGMEVVEDFGDALAEHAVLYAAYALDSGAPVQISPKTVADGLTAPFAGAWTLAACQRYLEDVIVIDDATTQTVSPPSIGTRP